MECHMRALSTPSADDRLRFHSNMPVSELTERDARTIEVSVVSPAPLVVEIEDGVTHESRPTPIKLHVARGLEPPDPRSRHQGSKAGLWRARGHLTSNKEPGEKTQMSLSGLCPARIKADRVISAF